MKYLIKIDEGWKTFTLNSRAWQREEDIRTTRWKSFDNWDDVVDYVKSKPEPMEIMEIE